MNRRDFLGVSGGTILSGLTVSAHSSSNLDDRTMRRAATRETPGDARTKLAQRPNLVLFMPDELRADSLSCYGNEVCRTPKTMNPTSEAMAI